MSFAKYILLATCLLTCSSALRMDRWTNEEGPHEANLKVRHPSSDLPDKFQKKWEQQQKGHSEAEDTKVNSLVYATGLRRAAPTGNAKDWGQSLYAGQSDIPEHHVKNVIGIPSIRSEGVFRKAHVDTWMQQDGVCNIDQHMDPNCHTFPLFFLNKGNPTSKHDIHLQDCEDREITSKFDYVDQNCKIYNLFKYAQENFPWATHVSKMDVDTFPDIHRIHSDLAAAPPAALYYGHYGSHSNCEEGGMQGAFFTFSADLLEPVVTDLKKDLVQHGGPADPVFGRRIMEMQRDQRIPRLTCINAFLGSGRWQHPV